MSICDSRTIQTIYLDECIGTSLLTLNNNFNNLKNQTCTDFNELTSIKSSFTAVSTNVTTLSSLSSGYAKAWVSFNGFEPLTIYAKHKIENVIRISPGKYTIEFETLSPFLSSNYALIGTCQQTQNFSWVQVETFKTDSVDINICNTDGIFEDSKHISILIYDN